jgi:hypothetical protein
LLFVNHNIILLKSNSFLDEAFGFIGYAGLNPAYEVNVKRKKPLTLILILYAGFSPAYSMEGEAFRLKMI